MLPVATLRFSSAQQNVPHGISGLLFDSFIDSGNGVFVIAGVEMGERNLSGQRSLIPFVSQFPGVQRPSDRILMPVAKNHDAGVKLKGSSILPAGVNHLSAVALGQAQIPVAMKKRIDIGVVDADGLLIEPARSSRCFRRQRSRGPCRDQMAVRERKISISQAGVRIRIAGVELDGIVEIIDRISEAAGAPLAPGMKSQGTSVKGQPTVGSRPGSARFFALYPMIGQSL